MSDRRRRRLEDEGEEGGVADEKSTTTTRPSECESEGESLDVGEVSEVESAADESGEPEEEETEDGSETETEEGSETEEDSETGTETEGGYTDEEGLDEERQSGDGEEQPENDKPDDDEDKKNPAYVPRRGAFYEHDFRQGDEGPDGEAEEELIPKKKLWQDEGKWSHDRFSEDQQAPKSREELISLYGYDIRTADKPPEAPPRKMGSGRGGPRRQKFQDFVPRMAVIDTTEDGADTIPNLDDDGFMQYEGGRGGRYGNNERRRGGRGGNRGGGNYRGGMSSNNRDYQESRTHQYDNRRSQDARDVDEFPTLEEISRQTERWDEQRNERKMQNSHQNENRRYNQRQDSYRKEERQDSRGYQQNHNERRGGYNSNMNNQRRRGDEDDRRSAQTDYRGSSGDVRNQMTNSGDGYHKNNQGSNQNYGYRKSGPPQDVRRANPNAGRSTETTVSNTNRGGYQHGYEQSANYRHQQHGPSGNGASREAKEYTNALYKAREDRGKQRGEDVGHAGDADDGGTRSSKNVVISNKENVQTINVTITTTEKKSYAKERRGKGVQRTEETAGHLGSPDPRSGTQSHSGQAQGPSAGQVGGESGAATSGTVVSKRYSSQRQQTVSKGSFSGPPPVDAGAKLYNPALPPPSFYQREPGTVGPPHSSQAPPSTAQDSTHFSPALLPPAATLPYGLPVSSTGLGLPPPTAAPGVPTSPAAMFRPPRGPPPPGTIPAPGAALISPPYLPAGMVYGGGPRVPPPGPAAGFPMPLAYTSPPPPPTTAAAVHVQPPAQGSASQPGPQSAAQPKKVYRGDITYYAPELQQPSRTPQKRPKAAIPIVDPQEIRRQKQKEKMEQRNTPERGSSSKKEVTPPRSSSSTESPKPPSEGSPSATSHSAHQDTLKQEANLASSHSSSPPPPPVPLNSGNTLSEKSGPLPTPAAVVSKSSDCSTVSSSSGGPTQQPDQSSRAVSDSSLQCNQTNGQKAGPKGDAVPVEIIGEAANVGKVSAVTVPESTNNSTQSADASSLQPATAAVTVDPAQS